MLIDGNALTGHRRLVDRAVALDNEAVCCDPLVGFDDHNIAHHEFLDTNLRSAPIIPAHQRGARCKFGKRFDGPPRAAQRVMLECMAKAEQEEQERTFAPGAQRGGTSRRHEHQCIDLEASEPEVVDRLTNGEETTEPIGCNVAREREPDRRRSPEFADCKSGGQQCAASQRENQLSIGSKRPPMIVVVLLLALCFFPGDVGRLGR